MAKVLIVDDSAFTRNLLGHLLKRAGHEIVGTAGNGTEALELYGVLKPDLVTLDYLMPDMNGEAVLGELLDRDPAARVIMISGSGDRAIEERAIAKGASLFIDKPDVQRRLVGAIEQVMHV